MQPVTASAFFNHLRKGVKHDKTVRVKNHQQGNGNLNGSVMAELRQQIVLLKRDLNACESSLSDHLYIMNEVQEALTIARECVQCLQTSDPFAAWEKLMNQKEKEFDDFITGEEVDDTTELEDAHRPPVRESEEAKRIDEAEGTVTKLVTPEMRQAIVELTEQLNGYAACLREVFHDMLKLDSLNRAVELADAMKCVDQLESLETRKRREQEAEEEEESLGDL